MKGRNRGGNALIDYDKHLNAEQLQVVMEDGGPLLVIAGAGSGKTRALTFRVARLIERGLKPERILLATFTNKAARSMLSRVRMLLNDDIDKLSGGTYHHNAHRILRSNAHLLGYGRDFSIIDSEDARQMLTLSVAETMTGPQDENFPRANILADIISLAANRCEALEEAIENRHAYLGKYSEDIALIAGHYAERKRKQNVMDFDDLLLNLQKLLQEYPAVLDYYSNLFAHVLVDEYQDTNLLQAQIVDLLASRHRNLMVVGDDSQSIYAFRGANFANIMHFPERYPDCKIFKLETNYRSTPEIIRFANLSITNNEQQFQKTLRAVREQGVKPALIPARSVFQQAGFVAQRILDLERQGISLNQIAVLYRAHYHSMELQMELTRWGIPYEIRSGIRFFEQAHVKDVVAYLRVLSNPYDELAWKRLLALQGRIGKATAQRIWNFIARQQEPLAAVAGEDFINCATKTAVAGLVNCRDTIRNLEQAGDGISDLIRVVLNSGYKDYMRTKYTDRESREDDLEQLADYASRFASLRDFLNELALLTSADEEEERDDDSGGRVVLSSIHQAKGLEWTVVMLIWCAEGMIPLTRALKEPDGEEEERRLFYVAVTRAKDQLYLCYPLFDYGRGMGSMTMSPSRFIREVAPSYASQSDRPYEQWVVEEE